MVRIQLCLIATLFATHVGTHEARAQDTTGIESPSVARNSYDFNIHFGSLLPSRNGVDNVVPGWGLRIGIPTAKGIFEGSGFSGIGNGAIYRTVALDYRMDLQVEFVPAHFLIGFHADQFDQTSPVPASSKFSGGWHYGGGISQPLGGRFLGRFDFRHRFSPGQVVEVTLGLTYRLPGGDVGN